MPTPSPGQTPGAPAAAALPAAAVVEVRGLWTVFGTGANAFAVHQDLDLTVQRGEILALVGGSGTGKTVLLRQMLGLARPTRGSVTVLGHPAAEMGREGAASRVGMLFQHGALFSAFDVLGNVGFALQELGTLPAALVRDAALVKLQMVGLQPAHATRMPADLSGGMIKRVALARALITQPRLLLLDEPFSALDAELRNTLRDEFSQRISAAGMATVLVTHDEIEARALAQRGYRLVNGALDVLW